MSPEFKEHEAAVAVENMRRAAAIAIAANWTAETAKEFAEVCGYETRRAQSLSYLDLLKKKARSAK